MDKTGIEWTDATWNPIRGCSKVSAGCKFCYAETMAARFSWEPKPGNHDEAKESKPGPYFGVIENGKWNGKITFHEDKLDQPLRWKKPRKIFVNSMSDLFHENVRGEWLDKIFGVMEQMAPQHIYQILTKRPERMRDFMMSHYPEPHNKQWPPPNIWLGVSVENQEAADERIPILLQTPAVIRWISAEPLLGPINLKGTLANHEWDNGVPGGLNWVVVGGESGPGSRPMHPDWALGLRDQCEAAGVPYLFKQWGDWGHHSSGDHCIVRPDDGLFVTMKTEPRQFDLFGNHSGHLRRCGKKKAGRELDGKLHDGYPNEN